MFITSTKSSVGETFYLSKGFRNTITGKNSTKVVERIGTKDELLERLGKDVNLKAWLKEYAKKRTTEEKKNIVKIPFYFKPNSKIKKDNLFLKNGGYLFLQSIMHELKLDKLCRVIEKKEHLNFNLYNVFSCLIYGKIFFPDINTNTSEFAYWFIEEPKFSSNDVYRTIKILADYCDQIQVALHKNERALRGNKNSVVYYDCTNYYFESDSLDKNNSASGNSAITELRLYFNDDSSPMFFSCSQKNEDKLSIDDYVISQYHDKRLYLCPDSIKTKASIEICDSFKSAREIELMSIRGLNKTLQEWILEPSGWYTYDDKKADSLKEYASRLKFGNISQNEFGGLMNELFYKRKKVTHKDKKTGKNVTEYLYVFFNFELQRFEKNMRKSIIERINKDIEYKDDNDDFQATDNLIEGWNKYQSLNVSSYVKQIRKKDNLTDFELDLKNLQEGEKLDGFYAFYSDLESKSIYSVIDFLVSKSQIDRMFNMIKNEYKSRKDIVQGDSIKAHFLTSFVALLVFKILEQRTKYKYWSKELLQRLENMSFYKVADIGWIPTYVPGEITDELHELFGFETDFEFIPSDTMDAIIQTTKES